MNKKILYWVIGIIVVVIIIVLILSRNSIPTPRSSDEHIIKSGQVTASIARQTIHDLISSGATETCTFSIAPTASTSGLSGTIYTKQGSMRGDFMMTNTAGKATNSHMIIASSTVFLWSDAMSRGVKLLWSVAASSSAMLGKAGGIDIDQPTNYFCANKSPDQSEFTLPTNTNFTDITSLIKRQSH